VRRSSLVYLALGVAGMAAPAAAQRPDSIAVSLVAPGVIHKHLLVGDGPWSVHVVEVDLRQPGITIRAAHADDKLLGLETVSALVHRKSTDAETIVAAVNADFFNTKTGEDENNQVVEGEIWKGLQVANAPEDAGHHPHTQLGIAGNGRPLIAPFAFHGNIWRPGGQPLPIDGINYRADANGVVLYTSRFAVTWLEGTFTKSFAGRNPRTGIGISRDSTTLYLITVDGRQEGSDGMSLSSSPT
jgi:hypothetical protein